MKEIWECGICGGRGIGSKHDCEIKAQILEMADNLTDKNKYPTFYETIVKSPQWQNWQYVAVNFGFDAAESTECGWLSPEHFQAFLKWVVGRG